MVAMYIGKKKKVYGAKNWFLEDSNNPSIHGLNMIYFILEKYFW